MALACGPPLRELPLDGGEGQRELLQPDLLLQQLDQLLRQVLQGGIWTVGPQNVVSAPMDKLLPRLTNAVYLKYKSFTLICVGAVQLPVQRADDGGQVGAQSLLPQVHGHGSKELEHARSLQDKQY